jgi:hypothetical protein
MNTPILAQPGSGMRFVLGLAVIHKTGHLLFMYDGNRGRFQLTGRRDADHVGPIEAIR